MSVWSPTLLDPFMWLSHHCFASKAEERIPLFGGLGLAAQLGNVSKPVPQIPEKAAGMVASGQEHVTGVPSSDLARVLRSASPLVEMSA